MAGAGAGQGGGRAGAAEAGGGAQAATGAVQEGIEHTSERKKEGTERLLFSMALRSWLLSSLRLVFPEPLALLGISITTVET